MKKKPIHQPAPRKPRRIETPIPEDISAQELEAGAAEEAVLETYRQGNFLIMYSSEDERAIAVDLNGKTAIHHIGTFAEIAAMLTALQTVKSQNQRVYEETFEALPDAEFIDEGLAAFEEVMAMDDPPMPDINEIDDLFETLRGSLLDELIKPPKKKP